MIELIQDKRDKASIATKILNDLPEWFGIPKYTADYIEKSQSLPFFTVFHDGEAVGFITLKETSKHTVEIFCMGVIKKCHHQGYGKKLVDAAKSFAIQKGYKFLQVKTVEQGKYENYDLTNAFYISCGFYVLEVFPTLWDEWNPCQVMVHHLER